MITTLYQDRDITRGMLSPPCKRLLKAKEKYLGRHATKLCVQWNRLREGFVFAKMVSDTDRKDSIYLTVAAWTPGVGWLPSR
jgi:hypothetical protein